MIPLVSVIIPTYNRATKIKRTLESVKEQSHKNWECIIVDDGSTDQTCDIVESYMKEDHRFQLLHRPSHRPKGANACRNIGLKAATGDYINFLDSDDTLHLRKFSTQISAIENTSYQFSVCQTMQIDDENHEELGLRSEFVTSSLPLDDYITFKCFWTVHPPLYKASFIEKYKFDEQLQQSQEYDFTIGLLAHQPSFHTTDEVLAYLHIHNNRMSSSVVNRIDKIRSNLEVRYNWMNKLQDQLQPQTIDEMYFYIFAYYKKLVLGREFYKAMYVFKYLVKCSRFRLKRKKTQQLATWFMAIPSYLLFNRGFKYLKYIN